MSAAEGVEMLLRELKLPSFVAHHAALAEEAEQGGWGFREYLLQLAEIEVKERHERKILRLRKASQLPAEKTLESLKLERFSARVRRTLPTLCEGSFVERAENLLAFGLPGRGKTHLVCAIGHELVNRGYKVLFTPAYRLVQRLLAAKRELMLPLEMRRLDRIDAIVLDDIGYIQQDREEMEVLFTLLAERYERRSVIITSNLVFSQWDKIFKDPMTTMAAIDRL
ncbi:MAG: ATP-binding protein, partial [bacterium]|nr:ATP-binding protein [bacterium]